MRQFSSVNSIEPARARRLRYLATAGSYLRHAVVLEYGSARFAALLFSVPPRPSSWSSFNLHLHLIEHAVFTVSDRASARNRTPVNLTGAVVVANLVAEMILAMPSLRFGAHPSLTQVLVSVCPCRMPEQGIHHPD